MKVALLGTSLAGKSSCARSLNLESDEGDMDLGVGVGAGVCPATLAMIDWILGRQVRYIAVSVHVSDPGKGILGIRDLKNTGDYDRLAGICFVYLFVAKTALPMRASARDPTTSKAILEGAYVGFEHNDRLFRDIAHNVLDTSSMDLPAVAAAVEKITSR